MSRASPPRRILFILNNFNDVDHSAPLIHRLLKDGHKVLVVIFRNFDFRRDPRIVSFSLEANFSVMSFSAPSLNGLMPTLFARALQHIRYGVHFSLFLLATKRINFCVYTWCNPLSKGIQTSLFKAAQLLGIPNICIPHGQNIFLNQDVNSLLRTRQREANSWPDFSSRNLFDLYIVQTEHHRKWNISWGMDAKIISSLGSMRFCSNWIPLNVSLFPPYLPKDWHVSQSRALKIVFFVPHWHYNVDEEATLNLLSRISVLPDVVLSIKGHTRGDNVPRGLVQNLDLVNSVDLNSVVASPPIIAWADVVINFGSSIGLEAIQQKKVVINPRYLHSNSTVFDDSNAVYDSDSAESVVALLQDAQAGVLNPLPDASRQRLIRSEVDEGSLQADPIDRYIEKIFQVVT